VKPGTRSVHEVSAASKMREETPYVRGPCVRVGARPSRIREDPDDDQNYDDPAYNLRYQAFSLPYTVKGLPAQIMSSLTEATGLACPRAPARIRISASLSLLTERHNHC
jgi:hypothetical protein